MTPDLNKEIRCHVRPYLSELANHQTRHQATINWAVGLVIAYGRFNFPLGFVRVLIDGNALLLEILHNTLPFMVCIG